MRPKRKGSTWSATMVDLCRCQRRQTRNTTVCKWKWKCTNQIECREVENRENFFATNFLQRILSKRNGRQFASCITTPKKNHASEWGKIKYMKSTTTTNKTKKIYLARMTSHLKFIYLTNVEFRYFYVFTHSPMYAGSFIRMTILWQQQRKY